MNFISAQFIGFFAVCLLLFHLFPRRYRVFLLLVGSYVFYATWSVPFLLVILATTSFSYWMGRFIERAPDKPKFQKFCLWTGISVNIIILCIFKYANFGIGAAWSLIGMFGLHTDLTPYHLDIILPLGISFYTFEAISYLIDVARGRRAARNFFEYNFYIMYFPHLLSGPIIRFGELIEQTDNGLARPAMHRMRRGLLLIVLGFVFKTVFADPMAGIADPIFAAASTTTPLDAWFGALAFTAQIYFDFLGYTHIARGVSLFFNIELPVNFSHPYNSKNISDFWRNWHISLSRWIRDYVYFPLGGSRQKLQRTVINLVLVMVLVGIWHGAGWNYIAWGAYNGVLLALYQCWKTLRPRLLKGRYATGEATLLGIPHVVTFAFVIVGWVIFRATDLSMARQMFEQMSHVKEAAKQLVMQMQIHEFSTLLMILVMLCLCWLGPWAERLYMRHIQPLPEWLKAMGLALICVTLYITASNVTRPFIYFQF